MCEGAKSLEESLLIYGAFNLDKSVNGALQEEAVLYNAFTQDRGSAQLMCQNLTCASDEIHKSAQLSSSRPNQLFADMTFSHKKFMYVSF